jgi:hypothetical protein
VRDVSKHVLGGNTGHQGNEAARLPAVARGKRPLTPAQELL